MTKQSLQRLLKHFTLAVALIGGSSLALAQGHRGPMMHGGGGLFAGHGFEHALDVVDASEAQRTQIQQIMNQARTDVKAIHQSGQSLHEQMLTLFGATNIDAAAIEALRLQAQTLHEQAAKRMSQAMIDAARVLTPEQRAKLVALMKKRQQRAQKSNG